MTVSDGDDDDDDDNDDNDDDDDHDHDYDKYFKPWIPLCGRREVSFSAWFVHNAILYFNKLADLKILAANWKVPAVALSHLSIRAWLFHL